METLSLIDELEAKLAASRRLPLIGQRLVSEESLWDLVDRLRAAIPADIREAAQLLNQRDQILQAAREEARRIMAGADEEFQARLRDSRVLKEAEDRAKQLLQGATEQVEAIRGEAEARIAERRREADQYTLEVLRRLDTQLDNFLTSVRRGIDVLESQGKGADS